MKVRNGFVSNSSSSSFILLVGKAKECPTCNIKWDILNLIDRFSRIGTETEILLEGKRAFEEMIVELEKEAYRLYLNKQNYFVKKNEEEFCFEKSWEYEFAQDLKNAIGESEKEEYKDFILAQVSIDYHDELINSVLKHLIEKGEVKEIVRFEN